MRQPHRRLKRSVVSLFIAAWLSLGLLPPPAWPQGAEERIAAVTRSQADEKAEAFLQRAYPGSRARIDPRFSTGSGVYRGFFVSLPDGRNVWVGLETQFSTLPGRTSPSAFLELTEKLIQSPLTWKVTASGVGPIKLGMSVSAVKEACALYPVLNGAIRSTPAVGPIRGLTIHHFGKRLLVAEIAGDEVFRIEVLEPKLTVETGIGAGSAVADLAEQYGTGELFLDDAGYLLTFRTKAPGYGFRMPRSPGVSPTWSGLIKANPRVRSLVLAGSSTAFVAETRPTGFPRAVRSRPGEAPLNFMKRALPGVKISPDDERNRNGANPAYMVQSADSKIHRVELRSLSAGAGRTPSTGPYSLSLHELRTPFKWQMTSGALGPIRLGMKRSQLESACAPYAVSLVSLRKGEAGDAGSILTVSHFGARLAEVKLDSRQIATGIQVLDPRWKTPQKAGVDSAFRELVRLYGTGELLIEESEVRVLFEKSCPGRSFELKFVVPEGDEKPLWPVLLKANPRVGSVLIGAQ